MRGVTATGVRHVSLRSGVYADSVRLMQVSRDVGAREGVTAVVVAMATPLNLELAAGMGLAPAEGASPDQLLVAVSAVDDDALAAAVAAVDAALAERQRSTASALTVTYIAPSNLTDDVEFSSDNGATWGYVPVAGNYASQGAVTHVRFSPKGSMAASSSLSISIPYLVK